MTSDLITEIAKALEADTQQARRLAVLDLAWKQHVKDGELEIDDNAIVSEGDDNGAYVQAWVWVDFSETKLDKEQG